ITEGYLVPLGLARVRRDGITVSPDARQPAVAETLRLVGAGGPVPAVEVAGALAEGPLGLTQPEIILVLNACRQSGLIEAWRGRRRVTEPFLALAPTDRLGPGELVEPAVQEAVGALGPITGPGPFDPWTSSTQRGAWDYAKAWLEARSEDAAQTRRALAQAGDVALLAGADSGAVQRDLTLVETVLQGTGRAADPAEGLRHLVAALPDGVSVTEAAGRIGAVARFLRDDLRRTDEELAYLTHPDLTVPADETALLEGREVALDLLGDVLGRAADGRLGEVTAAVREFRSAYRAAYLDAHDRHYAAVPPGALDAIRATAAYRAVAALSSIGALAVPDDRVKIDRLLAAAVPPPCRLRVDVELGWKPRCACRLALGDPPPSLDEAAVVGVAARGIEQYLGELARPETQARLGEAADDLVALGQTELAADVRRLQSLASGSAADADEVVSLLQPPVARVVREVLTGGQLIVSRDLGALREDLVGRRFPKRRLAELLAAWLDATGELPGGTFVEVVDGTAEKGHDRGPEPRGATAALLAERFPALAAALPEHQPADAFWVAAWWAGRSSPAPGWIPSRLLERGDLLVTAAVAAAALPEPRAELAELDGRTTGDSVLGEAIAAALDLTAMPVADVFTVLAGERLLSHPVRLAAGELVRRLAADVAYVSAVGEVGEWGRDHALLGRPDLAPLDHLVTAARHLASIERRLGAGLALPALVEDLYPSHAAPVPALVSRASLANSVCALLPADAVEAFRVAAGRVLRALDAELATHGPGDWPGCLPIWDVGQAVVAPLLGRYGRVAVLLVDAMRVDLGAVLTAMIAEALPERVVRQRFAVVPTPTRTAEALAALASGRPAPGGSVPSAFDQAVVPFGHLGYEASALVGADRDDQAQALRTLWSEGPPVSVAVATGVDERLHRTSVDVAELLDEAAAAFSRRVLPALAAVPAAVPLVLLADHGFRQNPSWGHGPEGRYVHGGPSLEESIVPVVVFEPG
ncbi:MAG TPA: hypothetical protein VF954_08405, partial [Acidimicrobiales bacterium]